MEKSLEKENKIKYKLKQITPRKGVMIRDKIRRYVFSLIHIVFLFCVIFMASVGRGLAPAAKNDI